MAHSRSSNFVMIIPHYTVNLTISQVIKPLWPFMLASGVTFYLVLQAQNSGVRCE